MLLWWCLLSSNWLSTAIDVPFLCLCWLRPPREKGIPCEETRVLDIQTTHENSDKTFWTHLPRIYKSRSLPFYKLAAKNQVLSTHQGITDERVKETDATEIKLLIKTSKSKKSTGFDLLSNFMIKKLPLSYIDCVAKCLNVRLRECRDPDECKLTKFVTLNKLKTGVPKCDRTRPISLLATHSKLF